MSPLSASRARLTAYALGLAMAAAFAYGIFQRPLQVTDSVSYIVQAKASPSLRAHWNGSFWAASYFRPLRELQVKLIVDNAIGHEVEAFKTYHAVLVFALLMLFVRLTHVRGPTELAAAAFALVVAAGHQTFLGLVWESYP